MWSEARAHEVFASIRWAETNGVPVCPWCKRVGAYKIEAKQRSRAKPGKPICRRGSAEGTPSVRRIYKCKHPECRKQFSVTSGTIWHDRKLPIHDLLVSLMAFQEGRLGTSAYRLRREVGCHYRTALVVERRVREAIAAQPMEKMTGHIYVDATFISPGKPRDLNEKALNWETPEWLAYAKEHAERELAIVTVRQLKPTRMTRTRIVESEGPQAFAFAKAVIDRGAARVDTDKGSAWNNMGYHLTDRKRHRPVNHSKRYVDYPDGESPVSTNPNESFHNMIKGSLRGVYGRGILHFQDFLDEMAWRADHRLYSTGEQLVALALACLQHPPSVRWIGYTQGRLPTAVDHTGRLISAGSTSSVYRRGPRTTTYRHVLESLKRKRSSGT